MSTSPKKGTELRKWGLLTDSEKLIAYLQGEITKDELNATDHEKLMRVVTTHSLLFEHKAKRKVVEMHINTFGRSEATAWRDIRLVEMIYGPLQRSNKDLKRAMAEEMILSTRDLAKLRKDTRTMSACDNNFIKLHGLDREDPELPDLTQFEQHIVLAAFAPEQVGTEQISEEDLLKRVDRFLASSAKDVEFEEVKDED